MYIIFVNNYCIYSYNNNLYNLLYNILGEISDSISSISERYRAVLRVNKAVVLYSRNAKKRQDSTLNEIQNNLKQTNIE